MPKVSVIVPVFNCERFIGDAIQSVLDQTFRDFEIIVVDDGSTDGTEKIVRQFSGPIYYHRQQNQGAGAARNLGVSLAKGEWIAFLDADDVWYRHKLNLQIEHTRTYPDVSLFYSDMDVIDERSRLTRKSFLTAKLERQKRKDSRRLISIVFNGCPFPYPSTVLVKKEAFLVVGGFNPSFRGKYLEDLELFARIGRISSIHFIPQSLAKYREQARCVAGSSSNAEENWPILWSRLWEIYKEGPEIEAVFKAFLVDYAKHLSKLGKRYLRQGDYQKARQYFRLAYYIRPLLAKNVRRWLLSCLPGLREFYTARKRKVSHRAEMDHPLQ